MKYCIGNSVFFYIVLYLIYHLLVLFIYFFIFFVRQVKQ